MSDDYSTQQIKSILDEDLDVSYLAETYDDNVDKGAIQLFQKIFVEILNFEAVSGTFGDIAEEVMVDKWNKLAKVMDAFLIAQHNTTRVLYVKLEKLTRTAQRFAISSLVREGWARKQEFIAIFYSPDSNVWHLVCPHITEGRTILRRYIVGEGENHRTVSLNLAKMDAQQPTPLFERIDEAFRLQPVTESFYKDYKDNFNELKAYLISQGLDIKQAKKYTHLLLNRLMFLYFIQKKGWLSKNKDFVGWFLEQYREVEEKDKFHSKWLHNLFFESMNQPPAEKNFSVGFPEQVCSVLNNIPFLNGGLFEEHEVDKLPVEIPDSLMFQIIDGFLQQYNFTITEESPFDVDVAVDPAMLGKIYESLIAEQERGKAGIFYTPRIEVDFMCRLAIFKYLSGDHEKIEPNTLNASAVKELTDEEHRDELIEFIFTPLEEWDFNKAERFEPLLHVLKNGRIVDPACGSGAFLVGMLQVLTELYRKMSINPDYHVKEMIVNDNLYGVDIKDWAIRMAEFRLWLNLIEGEEVIPHEEPVLPNFSFKLRVGDSIAQKIGEDFISLTDLRGKLTEEIKKKLDDLEELKERYFSGDKNLLDNIQKTQLDILESYIDHEISKLEQRKLKSQQVTFEGNLSEKAMHTLRKLDNKIDDMVKQKSKIYEASGENLFLWDLAFPEVMLGGGFDIVIANPPYVRREKLIRQDMPAEIFERMSKSEIKKKSNEYVDTLSSFLSQKFGINVSRWSDLYVYFFFIAFDILSDRGVLVYITSNSWLSVNFGDQLRDSLLKKVNTNYLIQNDIKRTFQKSKINTVITVAEKCEYKEKPIKFLSIQSPYESIICPNKMKEILEYKTENIDDFKFLQKKHWKERNISPITLWKEGGGKTSKNYSQSKKSDIVMSGSYKGDKWSKYLRAPDIFFEVEKNNSIFTSLKQLADVNTALMTGANEFFILPIPENKNRNWKAEINNEGDKLVLKHVKDVTRLSIEKEYWMHLIEDDMSLGQAKREYRHIYEDQKGLWVPNYILKSTRNRSKILTSPKNLDGILLRVNQEKDDLKNGVLEYINWGLNYTPSRGYKFPERENTGDDIWYGDSLWYDVEERSGTLRRNISECYGDLIWPRNFFKRIFVITPSSQRLLATDSFFAIQLHKPQYKNIIGAQINSSLWNFFIEIKGRVNLGEGALTNMTSEVEQFPVIHPKNFDGISLEDKYKKFASRTVGNVFKEFGAYNSDDVTLNTVKTDRREIDKIIMGDILGLSEEEQLDIYKGTLDLIQSRVRKAQSV